MHRTAEKQVRYNYITRTEQSHWWCEIMSTMKSLSKCCSCRLFSAASKMRSLFRTFCRVYTHNDALSAPSACTHCVFVDMNNRHHSDSDVHWQTHRYSPFSGRFHPRQLQWPSFPNWPSLHKTPQYLETTATQRKHTFSGCRRLQPDRNPDVTMCLLLNLRQQNCKEIWHFGLPRGEQSLFKLKIKHLLTNCPSSIPMTQAFSARDLTSSRQAAGTASIVFL